jgi:hypothetical protein
MKALNTKMSINDYTNQGDNISGSTDSTIPPLGSSLPDVDSPRSADQKFKKSDQTKPNANPKNCQEIYDFGDYADILGKIEGIRKACRGKL